MCGVVGIFGHPEAATLTYLSLYALQHRGQESTGIVAGHHDRLKRHGGMGLVADVFPKSVLDELPGDAAIGHVRYSTAGESNSANIQPFLFNHHRGSVALAHNGNLVNHQPLRDELVADGSIFQTSSDTETILHLVARSRTPDVVDAMVDALQQTQGAYSLVSLVAGRLIAVRDPNGFRPLSVGRVDGAWVVASETCVFDLIGAQYVGEVEPGEVSVFDVGGRHSFHPFAKTDPSPCFFEHVYFSRPDSTIYGDSVQGVRRKIGEKLWEEHPAEADVVVPVPDSGVAASLGYARASGLPFDFGLVRNHYVGRTFIEPTQQIRNFGVRIKLNPVREVLEGKRVILIDDSIVRGTTSRKIVQLCRDAGAEEIHLRIACPPTLGSCHYGIDTPRSKELIAAQMSVEEIREHVGADSLGYLSLDGMLEAGGRREESVCTACWTRKLPVPLPVGSPQQMGLFEKARRSRETTSGRSTDNEKAAIAARSGRS